MGFFKKIKKFVKKVRRKITKPFKKVWKKIGKTIKSAFKSFGRFMGKIGIVGQIAIMIIAPYAAAAFNGVAAAAVASNAAGVMGTVIRGAGHVMQYASKVVSTVGNVFRNVTKGVTETLGNFGKALGNKIGGPFANSGPQTFFGPGKSASNMSFGKGHSRFRMLTKSDKAIKAAQALTEKGWAQASSAAQSATTNAVKNGTVGANTSQPSTTSTGTGTGTGVTSTPAPTKLGPQAIKNQTDLLKTLDPSKDLGFSTDIGKVGDTMIKVGDKKLYANTVDLNAVLSQKGIDPTVFMDTLDPATYKGSLLTQAKAGLGNLKDDMWQRTKEEVVGLPGTAIKRAAFTALDAKVNKEIMGDQTPIDNSYSHSTYVPSGSSFMPQYSSQEFGGGQQATSYESYARANPYGNTAYQASQRQSGYTSYNQSMAQTLRF